MKEAGDIWMRWRVMHEYYKGGICKGMELEISPRSSRLLKRRGGVFEKTGSNEWVLWGSGGEIEAGDEVVLKLRVTDNRLFYVTEGEIETEYRFPLQQRGEEISLDFRSKRMVWEYILLPRAEREVGKPEVVDMSGVLTFTTPERIRFMGQEGMRTETTEKVLLCECYSYQLRLYEQKAFGRKMVCGKVAFPGPEGFIGGGRLRAVVYF